MSQQASVSIDTIDDEDDPLSIRLDDLSPIEIPFEYGGRKYMLREATEDIATKYKNYQLRGASYNEEGKVVRKLDGLAAIEADIVCGCIFTETKDKSKQSFDPPLFDKPVTKTDPIFKSGRVVSRLYEKIKAISELDGADTVESLTKMIEKIQKRLNKLKEARETDSAKNGHGATLDSSD